MDLTTPAPEPICAALLVAGEGQFTRAEALAHGVDDRMLARLVADNLLQRVRRGRYVDGAGWRAADDVGRHLMVAAAVLAATTDDTYLTGVTSLAARGVDLHRPDLSLVRLVRVEGGGRREAGVVHSDDELPEEHRGVVAGLRAASTAWSLVDYARVAPLPSAVAAMDSALHAGLTTREELSAATRRCAALSGARCVTRAEQRCDGRAESIGESLNRVLLGDLGLAPDELQLRIRTESGIFRVDFAWKDRRVAGEFDGRQKYGRTGEGAADVVWKERQRELAIERAGWVVVRFVWADLAHPERVRRRVLEAFARAEALRLGAASPA